MSTTTVDNVHVNGSLVFRRIEVSELDSEGVFEIDLDGQDPGAHISLADGLTLKGIRVLSSGYPLELEDDQELMLILSSTGTVSILHESMEVTEPTQRIRTSTGMTCLVDNRRIQIFWAKEDGGGVRRWESPVW